MLLLSSMAYADEPVLDKGDTSWLLISSILVLMMSIPGLALFYGGMVKHDNVLATLMQTFVVCVIISIAWPLIGYTIAFTEGSLYFGSLDKLFLNGVGKESLVGTIPETVFIMFQMTFAIITTAILMGSVADRIKFSAVVIFAPLWMIAVYAPIAHWVWGPGGLIGGLGLDGYAGLLGFGPALDYAGGTVVHINSGIAGLVAAIVIGRKINYGKKEDPAHNLVLSVVGAGLLWVGWFGFNAGSAVASGTSAGMAMLVTNTSAAAAALTWIFVEWLSKGKPSVMGGISGLVAGLVAITPASGFVGFGASLMIGIAAGAICYWAVTVLKAKLKLDDSLDAFGIHGIGGIVGALLTGVFASTSIGGVPGLLEGNPDQLMAQLLSVIVTVIYSGVMTYVLLKVVDAIVGLRVDAEVEKAGLDYALHGETVTVYSPNGYRAA